MSMPDPLEIAQQVSCDLRKAIRRTFVSLGPDRPLDGQLLDVSKDALSDVADGDSISSQQLS